MDTQNDRSRAIDVHEEMHSLFVLALLSAHPDPETVRGQFKTLLNGLAASHSRYVFGDDFVVSVRRSILRFDRMLRLVQFARDEIEAAAAETLGEGVDGGEQGPPDRGDEVAPQHDAATQHDDAAQLEHAAAEAANESGQRVT